MRKMFRGIVLMALGGIILAGCGNEPKVISTTEKSNSDQGNTGIFSDGSTNSNDLKSMASELADDVHKVTAKDVIYTSKYAYVNVTENGKEHWIATLKQEVEIGQQYSYKGGLLKTNFESKEHNRVFDTIYLVSSIQPLNHSHGNPNEKVVNVNKDKDSTPRNIQVDGSVKIADLVSNPEKYAGKTIQISGECTKINPNIMDINWIHLKDGSKDDFDLVVTSDVMIPEGHVVTMSGTVTLNKDFGAGYRYEIIIENGKLIR